MSLNIETMWSHDRNYWKLDDLNERIGKLKKPLITFEEVKGASIAELNSNLANRQEELFKVFPIEKISISDITYVNEEYFTYIKKQQLVVYDTDVAEYNNLMDERDSVLNPNILDV